MTTTDSAVTGSFPIASIQEVLHTIVTDACRHVAIINGLGGG